MRTFQNRCNFWPFWPFLAEPLFLPYIPSYPIILIYPTPFSLDRIEKDLEIIEKSIDTIQRMPNAPKAEKPVDPKPKRTLSEDQLAKLKVAREKALIVKRAMKEKSDDKKIQHYQEKIMKIKGKKPDEPPVEEELQKLEIDEAEEPEPEPEPEQEVIVKKPKPKPKKKPIVICEESSESEDDNSNVIYIKKGKRRQQPAPLPPPQPQPPPPPPPQPQIQRQVVVNPNPFYRYNMNHNYM
jgi:hypothetical protein